MNAMIEATMQVIVKRRRAARLAFEGMPGASDIVRAAAKNAAFRFAVARLALVGLPGKLGDYAQTLGPENWRGAENAAYAECLRSGVYLRYGATTPESIAYLEWLRAAIASMREAAYWTKSDPEPIRFALSALDAGAEIQQILDLARTDGSDA